MNKACEKGQVETVRELLKKGVNPNTHIEEENNLALCYRNFQNMKLRFET